MRASLRYALWFTSSVCFDSWRRPACSIQDCEQSRRTISITSGSQTVSSQQRTVSAPLIIQCTSAEPTGGVGSRNATDSKACQTRNPPSTCIKHRHRRSDAYPQMFRTTSTGTRRRIGTAPITFSASSSSRANLPPGPAEPLHQRGISCLDPRHTRSLYAANHIRHPPDHTTKVSHRSRTRLFNLRTRRRRRADKSRAWRLRKSTHACCRWWCRCTCINFATRSRVGQN